MAMLCYRCYRATNPKAKACSECGCVAFFHANASNGKGYPAVTLDGLGVGARDAQAAAADLLAGAAWVRGNDGVTARRRRRAGRRA